MFASPAVVVTGALLSLMVGCAGYLATAEAIESDARARFRTMARAAQYTIDARIKSYSDVLRGVAGLFRADPETSAGQFHQYVEQLDMARNFPGIEVINYARSVRAPALPALEAELRERMRGLGVVSDHLPLAPQPGRDTYTVLVYIEPRSRPDLEKLGMDLEARSYTRQVLAHARDANVLSASGTRIAIQPGPNQSSQALRLPVYRSSMPTATIAQRRLAYVGSAGIGFSVSRLVGGVLDEFPVKGTRLVLSDLSEVPAEPGELPPRAILYDSMATVRQPHPPPPSEDGVFSASLPIEFNQRLWRADFSIARSALYTSFDMYYPWLAAFAGGMSTALLYALFQTMASSRRNALRMAEDMTRELRASQAKLQASHEKLRMLAAHAEQIKEGERKRIAREIHDDLAQNLLALKIEAEMLANRTRGGAHRRLHARAQDTVRQIELTIRSVRQIINDLRPNVLDLGLSAAVDWQVADFGRRTGIVCELVDDGEEHRIDDHCATAFFRILQESLNNVARHAHASHVWIDLRQHADMLTMTIRDNGVGMQPGSRNRNGSFGLVGIEERVGILGGSFSISSGPETGTTIVVTIPVTSPAAPAGASSVPVAA
ncbi:hypothetical protein B0920_11695 [Massilia sp. KIM]|nr:hypothetical protein B0920_11695 [Massilia sp. KIM]